MTIVNTASTVAHLVTFNQRTEELLFAVLVQLVIIIGAARVMNLAFRWIGQPGVVGETIAGLLLGPSLLGHIFPHASVAIFGQQPAAPVVILSQIGLIFLMFQIGMNFEFGHLRGARAKRAVIPLAAASIVVPFGLGVGLGYLSAPLFATGIPRQVYSLFCGVAMAITAVPILGRILAEYGLNRHELGVLAISSAAINDVTGWLLLAFVYALATASLTPGHTVAQVAGVLLFSLGCLFVLRPAAKWLLKCYPVRDVELPPTLMAILLVLVFVMGMCSFYLGIFAIFGGFAAGLLFYDNLAFVEAWRRQVGSFVLVFFMPIFFTFTGLRTDVLGLTTATDWIWLMVFVAAATLGKILPVFVVGRAFRYNSAESLLLGTLMNTRGLMELIVLNIGLETGFIPAKVFTMLVIMAVVTTIMTGPILTDLMPRMQIPIPRGIEA